MLTKAIVFDDSIKLKYSSTPKISLFSVTVLSLCVLVTSAGLSFFSPWLICGIFLCLLISVLYAEHLNYYVPLWVLFFAAEPLRALPYGLFSGLYWGLVLSIVCGYMLRRLHQLPINGKSPIFYLVFVTLFIVMTAISSVSSVNINTSIVVLFKTVLLFSFIKILNDTIVNANDLVKVNISFLIGTVIVCLLCIPYLYKIGVPELSLAHLFTNRLAAFYGNANNLSVHFTYAIPILISAVIYLPNTSPRDSIFKALLSLVILFFSYILFLTFSRSVYLSVIVSTAVLLLFHKTFRKIFLLFLMIFLVTLPLLIGPLSVLFRLERGVSGRDLLWNAAFRMIESNPFTGIGPGNFESEKIRYILPTDFFAKMARTFDLKGSAHNLYLTLGSELGIFVSVLMLTFLIYLVFILIRSYKYCPDNKWRWMVSSAAAVLLGLLARSLFESNMLIGRGDLRINTIFIIILITAFKSQALLQSEHTDTSTGSVP